MLNSTFKEDLVKIVVDKDVVCFKFSGKLNFHTVVDVWKTCFDILKENSAPRIIIDCEKLSACDSAGINLLIRMQAETRKKESKY